MPSKLATVSTGSKSEIDFMSERTALLDDERIVIPSQLRQTVLDSLDLTQPESAAMLDLSEHV